ncbi:zinc-dependent peptidase [Mangrovivirga sp. M17]|uniref:Zinc-dependent peptidase n=1 Tax=Mangrovivirga halotolerans TaxID=2993936 RepID=A0ABT3RNQ4_9BACT|nr:zinc-dependent peptidase [Mangrovivirga halotolerans]MCX2743235.1 zinc-dependent peptidase [Mangrovivirga halotolerans]
MSDTFEFIIIALLVVIFIVVPVILLFAMIFSVIRSILIYFFPPLINLFLLFFKLPENRLAILEKYFKYYNDLPDERLKEEFRRRVQRFITLKQFIPRGGLSEVSEEMKVLIAASAIQISFGYPSVYFKHFSRILIYPDNYYSTITGNYHKGEVNLRGLIVLSWKNFVEGYMNHTDGINLGIHEMAHALKFENKIVNKEYNYIPEEAIRRFKYIALREMALLKKIDSHLFRGYASTNYHEFFAVSIEIFFEKPLELFEFDRDLYFAVAHLLNQDILNGRFRIT